MCIAAGGVVRLTATPYSLHKKLTTHEPSRGGLRTGLRDLLERAFLHDRAEGQSVDVIGFPYGFLVGNQGIQLFRV